MFTQVNIYHFRHPSKKISNRGYQIIPWFMKVVYLNLIMYFNHVEFIRKLVASDFLVQAHYLGFVHLHTAGEYWIAYPFNWSANESTWNRASFRSIQLNTARFSIFGGENIWYMYMHICEWYLRCPYILKYWIPVNFIIYGTDECVYMCS